VLLNLFLNALEAMRETTRDTPGTLTVSSASALRDGHSATLITVSDTGPGMPAEIRAHAFEPFRTTKQHGTGLGLAIAHAIMRSHGGEASIISPVTNDPARPGCAVTLFFPDTVEQKT
jgi:signal transduction histidine kinase